MSSSILSTCPQGRAAEGNATGLGLLPDASQQQRLVYTTAGTLWNPDSAKPIRAPVRRGRASVGALGAAGGDQWGFLPQNDGGSLFHSGQAAAVVPQYAPLQQNNDRAISPSPSVSLHGGNPASRGMASIEAGVGRSPIQVSDTAITPGSSQSDMASVKLEDEDDDDTPDISDDAFVRKLPMKTLVNLASYKNPFQQRAQHLLRVKANPGPPLGDAPVTLNNSTEATGPNVSQNFQSLAAAPPFVSAQPTQVNARPLLGNSAVPPKMPIGTQQAHSHQLSLFPSSTLATGPGAPEPLKAGPPGQRPQGPSKIESTLTVNMQGVGVGNSVQSAHGVYPMQPHRQYPVLNMPKETGGFATTGPSRPIPVKHYGHDGARSSKEHADAASEIPATVRNFNFAAHPGFRTATRTSIGEASASETSSRVATPPGFSRQDHSRSQGNSSQSARSGSGGVSVHQFTGYNAMSDHRVHTSLPLPDQRAAPGYQTLLAQQPTGIDPQCQNTAITTDTGGSQFIGVNPSQVLNNSGQPFPKYCGNENLGSNIRRVDSTNPPYGGAVVMPAPDGALKHFGTTAHAPVSFQQTTAVPREAEYWSANVESLDPYGWDPAEYHMPYFGQYPYGAMRMDDQMLRESEARINAWFYSNTSRLGKTMDEVLEERRHPRARPSPFGAIGDGRPVAKPGPKKTYSQISIEGANEMPASEHAKPLLNLAFQAILDFKDAEEARGCFAKNERKVKEDGESEQSYDKLGSAALLPSSFSDSD